MKFNVCAIWDYYLRNVSIELTRRIPHEIVLAFWNQVQSILHRVALELTVDIEHALDGNIIEPRTCNRNDQ